jgi:hypothetical protein
MIIIFLWVPYLKGDQAFLAFTFVAETLLFEFVLKVSANLSKKVSINPKNQQKTLFFVS